MINNATIFATGHPGKQLRLATPDEDRFLQDQKP